MVLGRYFKRNGRVNKLGNLYIRCWATWDAVLDPSLHANEPYLCFWLTSRVTDLSVSCFLSCSKAIADLFSFGEGGRSLVLSHSLYPGEQQHEKIRTLEFWCDLLKLLSVVGWRSRLTGCWERQFAAVEFSAQEWNPNYQGRECCPGFLL